jgi:hypothetical protein
MSKSLAEIVREKFNAGILPLEDPARTWAGFGTGDQCSVCGQPIQPSQTEYELRYDNRAPLRFHVVCHSLWDSERRLASRYRRHA